MGAKACEAVKGSDARRSTSACITMGIREPPVSVTLLQATVRRLNERGLALLTKTAQATNRAERLASWKEILPLWARASEATLGRAARCPMVLLDFNFQHVAWWSRVIKTQRGGEYRQPRLSAFRTDDAIPLARDLLLEAWSAARSLSHVSSLVFGMAPEVTTLISRLSPRDLERVVVQEIQEMRPRWENRPMFWKELFHAATQMDDESLANVHLHCLQLLGGEHASTHGMPMASATAVRSPVIEATVEKSYGEVPIAPRSLEFR
jgi:hypothetical protein